MHSFIVVVVVWGGGGEGLIHVCEFIHVPLSVIIYKYSPGSQCINQLTCELFLVIKVKNKRKPSSKFIFRLRKGCDKK